LQPFIIVKVEPQIYEYVMQTQSVDAKNDALNKFSADYYLVTKQGDTGLF